MLYEMYGLMKLVSIWKSKLYEMYGLMKLVSKWKSKLYEMYGLMKLVSKMKEQALLNVWLNEVGFQNERANSMKCMA